MEPVDNSCDSTIERVAVYIDGLNLYNGLREAGLVRFLWLDLVAFATNLLRPHQTLTKVNYYTAHVKGRSKGKRQSAFLSANSTSPHLNIRLGEFDFNTATCGTCGQAVACSGCGRVYSPPTEKQSDVNLGTQLGLDAASDVFDTAIIVSSDSDFVGAINLLEEYQPLKRIVVCLPPGRHGRSGVLAKRGSGTIHVNESMLRRAQFPREVLLGGGEVARRPDAWR